MSVIPLSVRLTDGTKDHSKPRYPNGTANIPYGYRLSHQGRTRPTNINVGNVKHSRRRNVNGENVKETRPNVNDENAKETKTNVNPTIVKHYRDDVDSPKVQDSPPRVPDQLMRTRHRSKDQKPISILPFDSSTSILEDNAKEERANKHFLRTHAFVERTDKRILKKNVRHLVEEGMAEYEKNIEFRREKLRSLLLSEEKSLTREIIDQAQRGADARFEDSKKRASELRDRLEKARQATVSEKRMQQYMTQCPEARDKISKKTTIETKYSNLVQIAENEAKREAEREVDGLWYELMLKEIEAKKEREIEEEKRRATADREAVMTLEKQIAGKLALSEEEKKIREEEREYLTHLLESVKQEELSNREWEKRKRAMLKKDLEEQLLASKRRLVERAKQEAAMEKAFRELSEAELAKERATLKESTSRLRQEILAYMNSLEELRREEAKHRDEVEATIAASAKEAETKNDFERKKLRESRSRVLREVLEGREQQLRDKRAANEEENKRAALEVELFRKESELDAALVAEAEARKRENAMRYGQELKAQQKYVETVRFREREENDRIHRESLEREQEYQKLTEELLNAPEIITPHAFKILLKECSARRDAEQKGLCYRPTYQPPPDYP